MVFMARGQRVFQKVHWCLTKLRRANHYILNYLCDCLHKWYNCHVNSEKSKPRADNGVSSTVQGITSGLFSLHTKYCCEWRQGLYLKVVVPIIKVQVQGKSKQWKRNKCLCLHCNFLTCCNDRKVKGDFVAADYWLFLQLTVSFNEKASNSSVVLR